MDEPDPNGQLPAVAEPLQPAGKEDLQLVAFVLPKPPDAGIEYPSSFNERLAYQCPEPVCQYAADKTRKDLARVSLEGTYARAKGIVVEPVRIGDPTREEVPKRFRRIFETVRVLFHPGLDELVHLLLRKGFKVCHHGFHDRVTDHRMGDIVLGSLYVDRQGFSISRLICSGYFMSASTPLEYLGGRRRGPP